VEAPLLWGPRGYHPGCSPLNPALAGGDKKIEKKKKDKKPKSAKTIVSLIKNNVLLGVKYRI